MAEKFARFMYGRYGVDTMNKELSAAALVLAVLEWIFQMCGLTWLAGVFLVLSLLALTIVLFRMFSKKIYKRAAEQTKYFAITAGIRRFASLNKKRFRDRNMYRYVRCPRCKTVHRAPRGKGKIRITCSKCGNPFVKKV